MSATDDGTRGPPTDAAVSDEGVTDSDGAEELTLVEAVCDGLHTEMARDERQLLGAVGVGHYLVADRRVSGRSPRAVVGRAHCNTSENGSSPYFSRRRSSSARCRSRRSEGSS